jgi:hypothetical protein
MTAGMMNLRNLIETTPGADRLRKKVGLAPERLMPGGLRCNGNGLWRDSSGTERTETGSGIPI